MKTQTSRLLKCLKYLVVFYIVFNCILGVCLSVFASYLLIFRQESRIAKAKSVVLSFLIVPVIFIFISTILGWSSVKRRNVSSLKCFAVLLSAADILLLAGCLWCFTSLPQINEQAVTYMEQKFTRVASDTLSESWWNEIQSKLKCCGLHGPTDYHLTKAVPFSCCGSDPEDSSKGSCSFMWQKGCLNALTKEVSYDMLLLGLVGLFVVFLQIPGVFITWCFANRLSKEKLASCLKLSENVKQLK